VQALPCKSGWLFLQRWAVAPARDRGARGVWPRCIGSGARGPPIAGCGSSRRAGLSPTGLVAFDARRVAHGRGWLAGASQSVGVDGAKPLAAGPKVQGGPSLEPAHAVREAGRLEGVKKFLYRPKWTEVSEVDRCLTPVDAIHGLG